MLCQRGCWPLKGVDCEIPLVGEGNEAFPIMSQSGGLEPKRVISTSGGLELLQMVSEPYIGCCANKDAGP